MILTAKPTAKDPCIDHPVYENLFILPYVKNRLVFAEMAVRAIRRGGFDLVLVDMPYFLNDAKYVKLPLKAFPLVSSLVIRNQDSQFITIPFVPNDAACAAKAIVKNIQKEGKAIEIKHVDDSNIINYKNHLQYPETTLPDDYNVLTDGIEGYFSGPFQRLEGLWPDLPEENRFYIDYRAQKIAERLCGFIETGKKILFVCEYHLWWQVNTIIRKSRVKAGSFLLAPWSDLSAVLIFEDPYYFWAIGLLDDYPAVVHRFYRDLVSGEDDTFDKLDALNMLIQNTIEKEAVKPSCRKMISFKRYLSNQLAAGRRFTPLPVAQLYESARSCLGNNLSKAIAVQALRYPLPDNRSLIKSLKIKEDSIIFSSSAFPVASLYERVMSGGLFANPSFYDSFHDRIKFMDQFYPGISAVEKNELKEKGLFSVVWEIEADYKLHQSISATALGMAERMDRIDRYKARKSWGTMGAGIHMKATIASTAKGEDAVYIKKRKPPGSKGNEFTETTPVVFVFADDLTGHSYKLVHDSNRTQRKIEMKMGHTVADNDPDPDSVYSVYATYDKKTLLCHGHVNQQILSSLVCLYHRHMGVERYESITRRDQRFHCRLNLTIDPELSDFTMNELGTAWAVKYARNNILLIARDSWTISEKLLDFARTRHVDIVRLPLSKFSREAIDRLRIFHDISTPLKKHPDRNIILERFLP